MPMEELLRRIEAHLARLRIAEYLERQRDWKRGLLIHFLQGVARGLGFALGFSVLGAFAVVLIRELVLKNLSGIGGFLAKVIQAIETRL